MYWFICPFIFFWREGRQSRWPPPASSGESAFSASGGNHRCRGPCRTCGLPSSASDCRKSTASDGDRLLKKIERLGTGRGTPRQKAQVVQELRQKYPLKALLQLAGHPRSTFYYYLHRSQNPAKYQMVKNRSLQSSMRTRSDTDIAELRKNYTTTIFV